MTGPRRISPIILAIGCLLVGACTAGDSETAVGMLERDRLDLVAEAAEPIVERLVQEGAYVDAGTLLVKLDPTRLEARATQAQAGLAQAEARLAELVRGPRAERITQARARLRGAEGRLVTARNEFTRNQQLITKGVISTELLERRRAAFDEALASRDASRAALLELLDGTTAEELAQAEAAVSQAEAVLSDARVNLARLEVHAPVAGWVDALPYEIGERPPVGASVVVLLADRSPYGRVYVPAAIRPFVTPGTPARVRLDGIDEAFDGRVRTVATEASFTPYFALTERDRGRLVYLAKVDLLDSRASGLPTGLPIVVEFDTSDGAHEDGNDASAHD